MFRYFTLDNFDFKGKVVGVRVDINSPIIDGKIVLNERIVKSAISIKELIHKGAKVVILAHQGRSGRSDCVSLKEHAKLLSKEVGEEIGFADELYSSDVEKKILGMKNKQAILLENLRFYDDEVEVKKKDNRLLKLEKLFDFYVFDAFSVSHRKQMSVIGFKNIINVAGRLLEKELRGLHKIEDSNHPKVFIFGGAKPDDLIELIEYGFKNSKVDLVILTGVIGEIALYLKGYYLGKKLDFLKEKGYLNSIDRIKEVLEKYSEKIVIPKDVALFNGKKRVELKINDLEDNKSLLDKFLIEDIGKSTIENISLFLESAASIYFKGPPGNFEEKPFEYGTKNLLSIITKTNAFTFMGGGHSVTSANMFKVLNKFSYVSLAGGALVKFLSGQVLPGVEMLENSFDRFEHKYHDFIVVGSNVIDNYVSVPLYFSEFKLGDKIKINDDFKERIGGGGINVSIGLSRLGSKVGYLGKFSDENFQKIKTILEKNKVQVLDSKLSKRPSAKSVIIDTKDNDRIIYTYRGQNSHLEFSDFDHKNFKANYYYFNSLTHESFDTLVKLSKAIKKNSKSVICYNPSSYLINNEKSKLKSFLKYLDILVLNLEEAEIFTGKEGVSSCIKTISDWGVKLAIITDGSLGSYAYDGNKEYFQKAFPVKKIEDTTGAGDCFAGTFFYFYSKGFGIRKALSFAAKNAASVISKKGPIDGLKYYEDIVNK